MTATPSAPSVKFLIEPPAFAVMRRAALPFGLIEAGVTTPTALSAHDSQLASLFALAVSIASPDLTAEQGRGRSDVALTARALNRYLRRSMTRATPFGLFASYVVVDAGAASRLIVSRWPDLRLLSERGASARVDMFVTPLRWATVEALRYFAIDAASEPPQVTLRELERTPSLDALLLHLDACTSTNAMLHALQGVGLSAESSRQTLQRLCVAGLITTAPRRSLCIPSAASDAEEGIALESVAPRSVRAGANVWVRDPRQLTFGPALQRAFCVAADTLISVGRPYLFPALTIWRAAFQARFEGARVPLLRALDPQTGVALGELTLAPSPMPSTWHAALARLAARGLVACGAAVHLDNNAREALRHAVAPTWRGAHLVASVMAPTADALNAGAFEIAPRIVGGPTGLRLLGRLAVRDAVLSARMRLHRELIGETDSAEVVFAEVVHGLRSEEGATGTRFSPFEHEICVAPHASSPAMQAHRLSDLSLFSDGARLHLWSETLGRRVVPRITSAQVPFGDDWLDAYRLLDAMQFDEQPVAFRWDWGDVAQLPYTPRVICDRVVLAMATWRIAPADVSVDQSYEFVRSCVPNVLPPLPRFVALVEDDERFPLDLDDADALSQLAKLWRRGESVVLEEAIASSAELPVRDARGEGYVTEFAVPLVLAYDTVSEQAVSVPALHAPTTHAHVPGGRWWYGRFFAPYATHSRLLAMIRDHLLPTISARVFLVRFGDPEPHLRLRVDMPTDTQVRCATREALDLFSVALSNAERVTRIALETYVPEIDRFGGAAAFVCAEESFTRQTAWLFATIDRTGLIERQLAVASALAFADGMRKAWCGATGVDVVTSIVARWDQLAEAAKMRRDSRGLRQKELGDSKLHRRPWWLGVRLGTALRKLEVSDGNLAAREFIFESHVHMFCNRVFDSSWKRGEYSVWCALRALDLGRRARASAVSA